MAPVPGLFVMYRVYLREGRRYAVWTEQNQCECVALHDWSAGAHRIQDIGASGGWRSPEEPGEARRSPASLSRGEVRFRFQLLNWTRDSWYSLDGQGEGGGAGSGAGNFWSSSASACPVTVRDF